MPGSSGPACCGRSTSTVGATDSSNSDVVGAPPVSPSSSDASSASVKGNGMRTQLLKTASKSTATAAGSAPYLRRGPDPSPLIFCSGGLLVPSSSSTKQRQDHQNHSAAVQRREARHRRRRADRRRRPQPLVEGAGVAAPLGKLLARLAEGARVRRPAQQPVDDVGQRLRGDVPGNAPAPRLRTSRRDVSGARARSTRASRRTRSATSNVSARRSRPVRAARLEGASLVVAPGRASVAGKTSHQSSAHSTGGSTPASFTETRPAGPKPAPSACEGTTEARRDEARRGSRGGRRPAGDPMCRGSSAAARVASRGALRTPRL